MEELTGDVTPDGRALASAQILATTPEKWDGVSRHWQQRGYVRKVRNTVEHVSLSVGKQPFPCVLNSYVSIFQRHWQQRGYVRKVRSTVEHVFVSVGKQPFQCVLNL